MKKILSLLMLIAITSVFAYQDNDDDSDYNYHPQNYSEDPCNPCPPEPCPPEPPCCDIPMAPTTAAYNAPSRINVCGCYDFNIGASFLYWQSSEEGLELAFTVGATAAGADDFNLVTTTPNQLVGFNYKFKPAFKIELGYNTNYDNWAINLQYTRVNFSQTTSLSKTSNTTLRAKWLDFSAPFTVANLSSVKSNWKLDFNIFDLDLSRSFYNGEQLSFKSFYGLKAGWIDQKYDQTGFFTIGSLLSANSCDSWLIGPRAGINGKWHLGQGVNFLGNASASIFYQKFYDIITRHTLSANTSLLLRNLKSKKEMMINGAFEYLLGFHYGTYFNRNNCHFDILAAYEAQIYLFQNEMRSQFDSVTSSNDRGYSPSGHLGFHGLTLSARFDF